MILSKTGENLSVQLQWHLMLFWKPTYLPHHLVVFINMDRKWWLSECVDGRYWYVLGRLWHLQQSEMKIIDMYIYWSQLCIKTQNAEQHILFFLHLDLRAFKIILFHFEPYPSGRWALKSTKGLLPGHQQEGNLGYSYMWSGPSEAQAQARDTLLTCVEDCVPIFGFDWFALVSQKLWSIFISG